MMSKVSKVSDIRPQRQRGRSFLSLTSVSSNNVFGEFKPIFFLLVRCMFQKEQPITHKPLACKNVGHHRRMFSLSDLWLYSAEAVLVDMCSTHCVLCCGDCKRLQLATVVASPQEILPIKKYPIKKLKTNCCRLSSREIAN